MNFFEEIHKLNHDMEKRDIKVQIEKGNKSPKKEKRVQIKISVSINIGNYNSNCKK
jgi:hypothetical protein